MAADDGMLDADTRESIAAGRRTAGEMLSAAQSKLRRVFIVFVVGLLGTIYAMRVWIWPTLKADLLARGAELVAITPFDVILLQAKIGLIVGVLVSVPPFLYYARDPLRERGLYPEDLSATQLAVIVALSALLFVGGVVYSYNVFFPVMFDFLANNAVSAGLSPTYSIVEWTQFIFVLALSFGLAAQLPLVMTGLSYAEIVPYETFRDKWKYAIVAMFGFGALFSPPDPFTQLMWAAPLISLYAVSLYLARWAAALKRGGGFDVTAGLRENANRLAGAFVLVGGVTFWFLTGGVAAFNALRSRLPAAVRPGPIRPEALLPVPGPTGVALVAALAGLLVVAVLTLYYARPSLEASGPMGDPAAIDLGTLDAEGLRAAPDEAFADLEEAAAVRRAEAAMEAGNPDRARALLDRWEAVNEGADDGENAEAGAPEDAGTESALGSATTDVVDAVTEGETTEEEIGGYYYDLAFIFDSLRSKAFRIFAVFLAVLVGVFGFLYSGGIGAIKRDFIRRIPRAVRPEEIDIVTLHPVEALVFEVKLATLLGIVAALPFLLYYAWPALESRGIAGGDRNVFFGWGAAIIAGLLFGSALGYLYVAPAVISYLVYDALQANMVISYRVSNFFWLVFFTTVGIGLWIDILVTMILFHRGRIVTFRTFRERWRVVTLGVLAFAAVFTPASVLSMVLVTIPVMLGYALGLGILYVYTLGGRRTPRPAGG